MDADEVRALIERYNAAWNEQDLESICSMHAPDIVFHNHTAGERAEGTDAVRAHIASIFANHPTMRFETRSLRTAEDFAVCEWQLQLDLDGQRVTWPGVDVFPIRNGQLARKDVYSAGHRPVPVTEA
jgi:ketosteroid isomerase-like protein